MHAQTFGTLVNTQVGIKEMVHRIFKGIVPRTNRKNIDLDLLKRYNTLFAIRHLIDGALIQYLQDLVLALLILILVVCFQIGILLMINP
jgi:hypothetical protein